VAVTFQTPIPISKALKSIQTKDYVLPAIQREFVWDTDQVCRLFDSLMLGYPIGSFLFWKVEGAMSRRFVFYDFIRAYHELKSPHCPKLDLPTERPVTAILEGQQRLTALNIGLRGSHAVKLPWRRRDNPGAYPIRKLYLNLAARASENDLGMEYDFRFLTTEQAAEKTEATHWFPVSQILDLEDNAPVLFDYIQAARLQSHPQAFKDLDRLREMVRHDLTVNFYEEEDQDLDKVLNIFIRVNSGGTVLSYSDLLLSIATAQWVGRDARDAIHGLVDELNQAPQDFAFSKDLVLKAGLVLTDLGDIRFKVTNFDNENMKILDEKWDTIANALRLAARLMSDFGFSDRTLTADSVLIPLSYYLHRRGASDAYLTSTADRDDREAIRLWVVRSLLKPGIWGSGLDTLLGALRKSIRDAGGNGYPVEALENDMLLLGKSLTFQAAEIEDFVETRYGSKRASPLLSLLYPGINFRNDFHEDHIFPRSLFTKKRLLEAGVSTDQVDEFRSRVDGLANLQLLEGPVNVQKQDMLPLNWAQEQYPDDAARVGYLAMHDMHDLPANLGSFSDFYEARRKRMIRRLGKLLGTEDEPRGAAPSVEVAS
jgi:hypothetical protein